VSQDVGYQVFATMATFYVPLIVILFLYWRIFVTARTRLRNRLAQKANVPLHNGQQRQTFPKQQQAHQPQQQQQQIQQTVEIEAKVVGENKTASFIVRKEEDDEDEMAKKDSEVRVSSAKVGKNDSGVEEDSSPGAEVERSSDVDAHRHDLHSQGCQTEPAATAATAAAAEEGKASTPTTSTVGATKPPSKRKTYLRTRSVRLLQRGGSGSYPSRGGSRGSGGGGKEKKHVSLEAKRERKAAKTLAIVTGAFIACWLPFFVMALAMPIFKDFNVNVTFDPRLVSTFLWLGYFNSTLNPVIYTVKLITHPHTRIY